MGLSLTSSPGFTAPLSWLLKPWSIKAENAEGQDCLIFSRILDTSFLLTSEVFSAFLIGPIVCLIETHKFTLCLFVCFTLRCNSHVIQCAVLDEMVIIFLYGKKAQYLGKNLIGS